MKWMNKNLSDICEVIRGVSFSKTEGRNRRFNNCYPVIRAGNIQDSLIFDKDLIYVPSNRVAPNQLIKKNDIIMCTSSGSSKIVGKCAISRINWVGSFGAFNVCLRSNDLVISEFLYYYLKSPIFSKWSELSAGVNIKNIRNSELKLFQIPLPPLPIQKKIAEVLDKADSLRQKRKEAIAKLDELAQSIFLDMFGDPVTNPKGWGFGKIRELVTEVKYGTSSKCYEVGEFPILRMNNITYKGEMDYSDLKYINLSENEKEKHLAKKGDLLFNRTNSKELVGKTSVYNLEKEMAIAGYLLRIRCNDKAEPLFISYYLNSKYGKILLQHMCKAIIGMANINAQEFQNIKIYKPPIKLQQQFASRIEKIQSLKEQHQQSLTQSDILFNSLMQRAFKGELEFVE